MAEDEVARLRERQYREYFEACAKLEAMERQYRADMAEWRRNIRAGQQRVRRLMAAIQSGVLAPELPFMDGAEEGEP